MNRERDLRLASGPQVAVNSKVESTHTSQVMAVPACSMAGSTAVAAWQHEIKYAPIESPSSINRA